MAEAHVYSNCIAHAHHDASTLCIFTSWFTLRKYTADIIQSIRKFCWIFAWPICRYRIQQRLLWIEMKGTFEELSLQSVCQHPKRACFTMMPAFSWSGVNALIRRILLPPFQRNSLWDVVVGKLSSAIMISAEVHLFARRFAPLTWLRQAQHVHWTQQLHLSCIGWVCMTCMSHISRAWASTKLLHGLVRKHSIQKSLQSFVIGPIDTIPTQHGFISHPIKRDNSI